MLEIQLLMLTANKHLHREKKERFCLAGGKESEYTEYNCPLENPPIDKEKENEIKLKMFNEFANARF